LPEKTPVAKQPKGELVVVGFDYAPLEAQVAEKVRSAAEAIHQQVRNTLESAIPIGPELVAVKEALPHGQFLPWLRAEFGWAERTARNLMAVAEPGWSRRSSTRPAAAGGTPGPRGGSGPSRQRG
jgi:Protein of unknown function (DUF3102)